MLFARGRSGPVILMMRMTLSFTGGKGKHFSVKGREEYKPVRKRKEPLEKHAVILQRRRDGLVDAVHFFWFEGALECDSKVLVVVSTLTDPPYDHLRI